MVDADAMDFSRRFHRPRDPQRDSQRNAHPQSQQNPIDRCITGVCGRYRQHCSDTQKRKLGRKTEGVTATAGRLWQPRARELSIGQWNEMQQTTFQPSNRGLSKVLSLFLYQIYQSVDKDISNLRLAYILLV